MVALAAELDSREADRIIIQSRKMLDDYRQDMLYTEDPLEVAGLAVSVFGNLWLLAEAHPHTSKDVIGLIEQYRDLVSAI